MKSRHLLLFSSVCFASTDIAGAAARYYDSSTSSIWDTNATQNWGTALAGPYNTAKWLGFDAAFFTGTAGTVTIAAGGVTANAVTFKSNGYIINGGTLSFGNPSTINLTVDPGITATINSQLTQPYATGLYKGGTGTLKLGGTGSTTTTIQAYQGTLEVTNGSLTTSGDFFVGRSSFGTIDTSAGEFKISGGSVTVNAASTFYMGQTKNGTTKVAQFTQTGGSFSYAGTNMNIGNGGGVSQLDLSGGTFTATSAPMKLGVRANSTLNISGTADVALKNVQFFWATGTTPAGIVGTVNLNGGTLAAETIFSGAGDSTSVINFNGGLLKARTSTAGFLGGLSSANVKAGGAKIDTNNFDITISQALLHDSGLGTTPDGGLTKSNAGKLTLSGNNTYTGATTISAGTLALTGSGSIASSSSIAIAGAASTLDVSGIAAGSWTVGGSQTVSGIGTLNGGAKALSVAGTLAPGNSAGNLGINLSSGGTLNLTSSSILAFELGATSDRITFSSAGNWLTGSGNATLALTLLGSFDYSGTYTIFDNVTTTGFTLADITGYDETNYSANFLQSGTSYNLTFTPIPEPRAALIGGIGMLALLRRRR